MSLQSNSNLTRVRNVIHGSVNPFFLHLFLPSICPSKLLFTFPPEGTPYMQGTLTGKTSQVCGVLHSTLGIVTVAVIFNSSRLNCSEVCQHCWKIDICCLIVVIIRTPPQSTKCNHSYNGELVKCSYYPKPHRLGGI